MARKPSIIMSAAERKSAKSELQLQLKNAKQQLKDAQKLVKQYEKEVLGLETRLNALTPPKQVSANAVAA